MKFEIVIMGTSRGGLHALETVLGALPSEFPLPVAVVQHRSPDSDDRLCELLEKRCALSVVTVEDKEAVAPGKIYMAPPDYHLLLGRGSFELSTDASVCNARPSIDVLFESAADAYGEGIIAVVMTGANHDGAQGLARVKKRAGITIVEDPESAESPQMPEAAISCAHVDHVLDLENIAPLLKGLCSVVEAKN